MGSRVKDLNAVPIVASISLKKALAIICIPEQLDAKRDDIITKAVVRTGQRPPLV
jgi:hypothetical protein